MLSQSTVVWVGAGASAVVVAGAAAGALIWIYPEFLRPGSAATQVEASASEPKPLIAPQPAAPAASVPTPGEATTPPPKPAFDVVSVEPTGEAVIAGRAAPNATVELRDAGRTVAQATADASGQFVIIPPAFAPGDHSLSLAEDAGKAGPETSNPVAVSVPQPAPKVVVAAAAPPKAPESAPLAPPLAMRTLATGPSVGASGVAIQSVAADAAGGLIAKGSAPPNATVRLYLNGADVGDAKTQTDGRWSLTIKHGMTPGGYVMRADEIKPGDASVAASADTPFEYPAAPGASGAPATPAFAPAMAVATAGQSPAPPSADLVVDSVQTARVVPGHTLWALSRNYYGDPTRYPVIYEANKSQIHNPNLIYPGQVFVVPKFEPKP
jgi:nucleoid-associated protein YgaU